MSSLLSLIIGTVVGLTQFRIKRLLAYSTISHVGFILLALSITSIESIQAFVFYLMQYSISNLNAFIILVTVGFSYYLYVTDNKEHKELLDKNNSPVPGGWCVVAPNREPSFFIGVTAKFREHPLNSSTKLYSKGI